MSVVTIGVFDGVHRGHRVVVGRAVQRARERGEPAIALTFDPHPVEVVRPGAHPCLLVDIPRRVALLREVGIDEVVVEPFTPALARLSPQAFVEDVLVGRLGATLVVVGENFRFGHRAAGDTAALGYLGAPHGMTAEVVGTVDLPIGTSSGAVADRVSSTRIRTLVAAGDVAGAAAALGRPHRITGPVVAGARRGRVLGYPTANVAHSGRLCLPADGVYAARLLLPDDPARSWGAAVSVGTNPTFDGTTRTVEAYCLDAPADLDLYGREVDVDLVARIRPMARFADVDDLLAAMAEDVVRTRAALAGG